MVSEVTKQYKSKAFFDDAYRELFRSDIQQIAGIKLSESAKPLGSGTQGVAYGLPGGKVLKISLDATEANAATLLIGKNLKGLYQVYGVYKHPHEKIYYVVQEKLAKGDQSVYQKWETAMSGFIRWNKWGKDSAAKGTEKNTYILYSKYYEKDFNSSNEWSPSLIKHFNKFVKEDKDGYLDQPVKDIMNGLVNLRKLGIEFRDLWQPNIMKGKKGYVIIDIGYSRSGGSGIKTLKMAKVKEEDMVNPEKRAFDFGNKMRKHFSVLKPNKMTDKKIIDGHEARVTFPEKSWIAELVITADKHEEKMWLAGAFHVKGKKTKFHKIGQYNESDSPYKMDVDLASIYDIVR